MERTPYSQDERWRRLSSTPLYNSLAPSEQQRVRDGFVESVAQEQAATPPVVDVHKTGVEARQPGLSDTETHQTPVTHPMADSRPGLAAAPRPFGAVTPVARPQPVDKRGPALASYDESASGLGSQATDDSVINAPLAAEPESKEFKLPKIGKALYRGAVEVPGRAMSSVGQAALEKLDFVKRGERVIESMGKLFTNKDIDLNSDSINPFKKGIQEIEDYKNVYYPAQRTYERSEGAAGFVEDVAEGFGQFIPQVGMAAMTGGQSLLAPTVYGAMQMGGLQYDDLVKEVGPDRAATASMATAVAGGALERIGLGKVFQGWKPSASAAEYVKKFGAGAMGESMTEFAQKYPEYTMEIWARTEGMSDAQRAEKFFDGLAGATREAAYEGLIGGIVGGTVSLGGGVAMDKIESDKKKKEAELTNELNTLKNANAAKVRRNLVDPESDFTMENLVDLSRDQVSMNRIGLTEADVNPLIMEQAESVGAGNVTRAALDLGLDSNFIAGLTAKEFDERSLTTVGQPQQPLGVNQEPQTPGETETQGVDTVENLIEQPRDKVTSTEELVTQAEEALPESVAFTNQVAEQTGGAVEVIGEQIANAKNVEQVRKSVEEKYGGDAAKVTDAVTSVIQYDTNEEVGAALEKLKADDRVVSVDENTDTPKVVYRTENGHLAELGLTTKELAAVKQETAPLRDISEKIQEDAGIPDNMKRQISEVIEDVQRQRINAANEVLATPEDQRASMRANRIASSSDIEEASRTILAALSGDASVNPSTETLNTLKESLAKAKGMSSSSTNTTVPSKSESDSLDISTPVKVAEESTAVPTESLPTQSAVVKSPEVEKRGAELLKAFSQNARKVMGKSKAKAIDSILKARAASAGISPEMYFGTRELSLDTDSTTSGVDTKGKKGALVLEEGKATIQAFEKADVGTVAHELGHLFRRDLSAAGNQEMIVAVESELGVVDGNWTKDAEEEFARGFEKYLRDGTAPTSQLKKVFAQFKRWMTEIYRALKGSPIDVNISEDVRGAFDALLTEGGVQDTQTNVVTNNVTNIQPSKMSKAEKAALDQPDIKVENVTKAETNTVSENASPEVLYQDVTENGHWDIPTRDTRWQQAKYNLVNKHDPLKRVVEEIGDIPPELDTMLKETLRVSKSQKIIDDYHEQHIDPIIAKIKESKTDLKTVERVLYANHAPEANRRLRRINSRQYLDALIAAKKGDDKKALQERVEEIETDADMPIDMKQQLYLNLLESNFGDTDKEQEIETRWNTFKRKPSGMTDAEAARIKKEITDPKVKEIAKEIQQLTEMKVDVLYDAGLISDFEAESWGQYDHYVPLKREGFEGREQGTGKGLSQTGKASKIRKGSSRRAVDIFANIVADYERAVISAGKAKSAKTLKEMVEAYPNPDFWSIRTSSPAPTFDTEGNLKMYPDNQAAKHEIPVKVDGKQYIIHFNPDYEAGVKIAKALKNDIYDHGPVLNAMSWVTRQLAQLNTSLSPEFVISNFFRDIQTAAYNMGDTDLKSMQVAVVADVLKAGNGIHKAMTGRENNEWSEVWDDFRDHGGKVSWMSGHDTPQAQAKDLQSRIDTELGEKKRHIAKRAVRDVFKHIESANTAVENAIRLSFYKQAVARGIDKEVAARMAKELTTNFETKGAYGQAINAFYMFANAGIQGNARLLRALINSPQTRRMAYATMAAAATLDMANRTLGGEDEDGEPYYDKIEDFVKERNAIIMSPFGDGHYVKIPLPWGYNVVWNMGAELGGAATDPTYDVKKGISNIGLSILNAFNPVQAATWLQTAAPTILDPIAQVKGNETPFGTPLRPESPSFGKVKTPDHQLHWRSVRPGSKFITKAVSDLTGGDAVEGGKVDVSPESLDMIIDTVTGAAGRFVLDAIGAPVKLAKGEGLQAKEVPFLRKVYGTKGEHSDSSKYREHVTKVLTNAEKLKSPDISDEKKAEIRKSPEYQKGLFTLAKVTERNLKKLRKQRRDVPQDSDAEKAIVEKMNEQYVRFNKKYNAVVRQ